MFDKRTLITFLGMLALSKAINPDNICILVADGTKIVDGTNCASYYTCTGGKATAVSCPTNQYFSKDKLGCVPQSQATCVTVSDNPCDGVPDEEFVAKPNSCSGFYYCKKNAATEGSCPDGLNFNPHKQACQYKTEFGCAATGDEGSNAVDNNPDLICAYVPNGIFFGNAANCKTWHKCTENILQSGDCGDYVYDVKNQRCEFKENYDCQQLNGDSGETGGTPSQSCTDDGKVVADPDSCSRYLTCVNKKYVASKCSAGTYFDPETGGCGSRQDAKNDCDRCEGTSLQFVNVYGDGCKGYLICSNGKQVGQNKCDEGYFFHELYGSCVKDTDPGYNVCKKPLNKCADCVNYLPAQECGTACTCSPCPKKPPQCKDCAADDDDNVCNYVSGQCTCDICEPCDPCHVNCDPGCEDDGTCDADCDDPCPVDCEAD